MIKNKKGSHFGMMISFAIFISFLVVFYALINQKTKSKTDQEIYLNKLLSELKNSFKSNISEINIKLNESQSSCFKIDKPIISSNNVTVKDHNKNIVDSYSDSNYLYINSSDTFFKIYYSDEFNTNTPMTECNYLPEQNYTIGLIKTEKKIFEKKIKLVIKEYNENYDELKNNLSLPQDYNFEFSFINSTGGILNVTKEKSSQEIFSKKEYISYIDENANHSSGYLIATVW